MVGIDYFCGIVSSKIIKPIHGRIREIEVL